ncbi:MAG: hypothetical protein ACOY33_03640 [Pseudomonadota bacterium]
MKTSAARQDGIAALRQRLFFANELLKLAARELTGDALNRQAIAMACRQSAVLQLHAVLTGLLDDIAGRLRIERSPATLDIATLAGALAARGMASPELNRVATLAENGWLRACMAEAGLCLSSTPGGQRDEDDHDHNHDHEPAPAASGGRIAMKAVAPEHVEPLADADFARIRSWIAGWKELLDEFLVTLDEF